MKLSITFFLAALVASCHGDSSTPGLIEMLRPRGSLAGHENAGINCLSWRLAVETNNIIGQLVPESCENYIGNYMLGKQYREDCNIVAATAYDYAKNLTLAGDGKDIWVFDIDETTLSNMPYYARSDVAFGSIKYNNTKFNEWLAEGTAPPIPASLKLYKKLVSLGFKIVFLTGTLESFREVRIKNLKLVGYHTWEKLIMKKETEKRTAVAYKSNERKKLEEDGYRILGNMGDQWSDLIGTNVGKRTFKVPDPMYYIG